MSYLYAGIIIAFVSVVAALIAIFLINSEDDRDGL